MKLRNKKTGEIIESFDSYLWDDRYSSLAELNEEWEDYAPKEPRINDSRVCKIVRNWYRYNTIAKPMSIYYEDDCTLSIDHCTRIEFFQREFAGLDRDAAYTITELCGEEE